MNAITKDEAQVLELEPQQAAQVPVVQQTGGLVDSSPAGMMMTALSRGMSPADVREMLALQREWRADEARNAFNEALAKFKAEAVTILKNKFVGYETNDGQKVGYHHAELFDVVAAVGPALSRHGLGHRWDVKQTKDWITVTCILKHSLGHSESCEMGGPPDNSGKKNPIQQIASTVSYLQRYTLKAICGVAEGGEDDDGKGGPEEVPADELLDAWRAEALKGEKALRAYYEANTPTDEFWSQHKVTLKEAARKADADAGATK